MASFKHFLVLFSFVFIGIARASDPDILFDYIVPDNISTVDENFFTYTKLRGVLNAPVPVNFNATQASKLEFPALNGQSVSYSILRFAPGGVSAPHTRPHSTGLLFLLRGTLEVGFVDTSNKLYTQTLQQGDMFIFPKGLVHYQYNADLNKPATAIAAFGSASAGTVLVPTTLFSMNIDDEILATSLKTDVKTIQKLKKGLAPSKA